MRSGNSTGHVAQSPRTPRSGTQRWLARFDWPVIVRRIAVLTAIVLFLVHVMGTFVTDTGSQAGCGNSWPLCKGQFIPSEFAHSTLIEFSHRIGVPLVTILLLALIVGVVALWRDRLEIKILAPLMFFFLFLQALLGGLAVMYPTSAVILAFHFGVSSLSVASVIVTMLFIFELGRWDKLRDRRIPVSFRALIWGITIYTYVVIYLGAYVLHTNSALACTTWPLCSPGRLLPPNVEPVVVNMTHRVGALILTLAVVGMFLWARRLRRARPDLYRASVAGLILIFAQALEGAVVVFSRANIWAEVMHSAFIALFFSVMVYMCLKSLPRPASARTADGAGARGGAKKVHPSRTAAGALNH
ncbi:MAG TPA: COX15/CtaA family protein [Ktedonobacterales bacterium]|nr:COX15/CtaA family protein [Ktedonobacterales bacterium]